VRINPTTTNEDARYEGTPVGGKPECPYFFNVVHRKPDPALKFTQRVRTKLQYMYEDTFAYVLDLFSGRVNEVMWKTSAFLWRRIYNLRVLLVIWDLIKHGVHVTVHGMKELYREGKWAIGE
jgi:hypothetical protein